jgi:hypothetical protein
MQDKDQKLIWESYTAVSKPKFTSKERDRLMGMDKETPKPVQIKVKKEENDGQLKQLNPAEITTEHLMYPDVMPGEHFEEDHLTELPHFAETYHATSKELMNEAEYDKEEGDLIPEQPAVFTASVKYEFTDDENEGVVIIYANDFMTGFYVNSKTHKQLEDRQTDRLFNSDITWNYGTSQQPAMKTLNPRNITVRKYEEMKEEEGSRYSDY